MNTELILFNFMVIPKFPSYKTDYIRGKINRKTKFFGLNQTEIIASNYGKKGLSVKDGDLNKDGIVDEKDIRFVEKNFLKKGPDASKSQTPVEKSKSGTLADILKKLGLTPKK